MSIPRAPADYIPSKKQSDRFNESSFSNCSKAFLRSFVKRLGKRLPQKYTKKVSKFCLVTCIAKLDTLSTTKSGQPFDIKQNMPTDITKQTMEVLVFVSKPHIVQYLKDKNISPSIVGKSGEEERIGLIKRLIRFNLNQPVPPFRLYDKSTKKKPTKFDLANSAKMPVLPSRSGSYNSPKNTKRNNQRSIKQVTFQTGEQ